MNANRLLCGTLLLFKKTQLRECERLFYFITWSMGSVNSENAFAISRPQMNSSNLSVKPVLLLRKRNKTPLTIGKVSYNKVNDPEDGDSIGGNSKSPAIARKQSSRTNFTCDVAWPREIFRLGSPRQMWAEQALALQQLQKPGNTN